jgi:hypothetical protein
MPYKPSKKQISKSGTKEGDKIIENMANLAYYQKKTGSASQGTRLNKLSKKYGSKAVCSSMGGKTGIGIIKQIDAKVAKGMEMKTTLDKKKKKKR